MTCSLSADGYGNPGLPDDGFVVLCHIEVRSGLVVSGTNVDTDEDIADPMLNHDNKSKELIASLVVTLNSSANGGLGTVAGTVMNSVIYNSGEAANVVKPSTVYLDVISE